MDFGFIQNSELTGLAGLGQEEIQGSGFSFQFGQRGSQTFILECGIKRVEKRFSMRIKHQQTRDFFMYSHCVDLISGLLMALLLLAKHKLLLLNKDRLQAVLRVDGVHADGVSP